MDQARVRVGTFGLLLFLAIFIGGPLFTKNYRFAWEVAAAATATSMLLLVWYLLRGHSPVCSARLVYYFWVRFFTAGIAYGP